MGLLGNIIAKGVTAAATTAIIKTVGDTTVDILAAAAQKQAQQDDAVEKSGKLYIKPTRSSKDYIGKSAFEITQELLGVGFECVTLKPAKKLKERSAKKYGSIQAISINGNAEFLGIKRVPSSSHVVIEFLDFKDDVSHTVYSNVKRLNTGRIRTVDELEYSSRKSQPVKNTSTSFCPYCGERVFNENAKFCSVCGKEF